MKQKMRILAGILVLSFALVMTGCAQAPAQTIVTPEKGPITVATMIDTEGPILGQMVIMLLQKAGFKIVDKTEFGTPDILRKALVKGDVDLVIDYTGSGQYYHETKDTSVWSDPVKGYEMTKQLDKAKFDLVWLTPANANNTEELAVTKAFADANNLATMEDFAKYVNGGGNVKLITSASFSENIKGLRGLEEAYGFKLKDNQLITLASGNTTEMIKALSSGKDGVNVSLVYGTDGALDQMNLVVLSDLKSIPPVYLPTPVIRGALIQKYPEIETILGPAFSGLTIETLRELNAKSAFDGQTPKAVAEEYLKKVGLLN